MSEFTPELLKSHFFHLVKEAGGVVPAGAVLDLSHQRVSQLQSTNCPSVPTWEQVFALESFIGRSVVFEALARMVEGDGSAKKDALEEACDVTEAAANLLRVVRDPAATQREIQAAIIDVQREAQDVSRAVRRVV